MIRQLMKSIREYKKLSIMTPILIMFEVIMECLIPYMIAILVNHIKDGCKFSEIAAYGGILFIMACFSLLFGALAGVTSATASCGFAKNLRHDLYYKVQSFSFSNIDRFSSSSLVTRMTTDVTNVQNAYMMIIRTAVRSPLMFIFAIVMAFKMGGLLALMFVVVVPILLFGLILIARFAMPMFRSVFRKYDKLNESIEENVRGMRVVKSYVREEFEKKKFDIASDNIRKDFTKAERIVALNGPLMQFCLYTSMLLVSWFGAKMIVGGSMTTGELMSLITYLIQILTSLMMLSFVFVMIVISRASAERIVELLEEESDLHNGTNPIYEVPSGEIVFENVDFSYAKDPNKLALSGINVTIHSGETIGIIGGTGSSKTSLVQLIPRLYDVTNGRITVGGNDVRDYDVETLRNEVAMVLQKNVLFSGSIKENLRWGCEDASEEEMIRVCKLAQADDFIQLFPDKYDTYIEQGGSNVSGGQRQRLCIARALLKKPKILILDDSTSAVDTKTDALIRKAFLEEIPDTTKIIIAQRVSSIQDADRIIVMEGGKVNAIGTHEELLQNNSIYREVYYSQVKGGIGDGN